MPASIGVNLRVTGHCRQGGRKYMEDYFSVAYQQTDDEKDLEYAFFGIYDGHGGAEAAAYAKEHLMENIVSQRSFWSDCDDEVLRAVRDGFLATHLAMWKDHENWPKTASGLNSTAGTTASIAFIRRGKIYIGHVGDSGIILGYQEPGCSEWKAKPLTNDHKPENENEIQRIQQCGGKVVAKSGVPRVVWNRPRLGHRGPVRRSTPIDEIPFLAVARSLGDLWSYNAHLDEFVVSPDPDCSVHVIDPARFRCLVLGTDGLYNMVSAQMAVRLVQQVERHNEQSTLSDAPHKVWLNPSKCLVEKALERWLGTKMRADNTSVVTLMLDPPGPPRAQVLRNRKRKYTDSGLEITTRYEDQSPQQSSPLDQDHPSAAGVAGVEGGGAVGGVEGESPVAGEPAAAGQILGDEKKLHSILYNQFSANGEYVKTEDAKNVCTAQGSTTYDPKPLDASVMEEFFRRRYIEVEKVRLRLGFPPSSTAGPPNCPSTSSTSAFDKYRLDNSSVMEDCPQQQEELQQQLEQQLLQQELQQQCQQQQQQKQGETVETVANAGSSEKRLETPNKEGHSGEKKKKAALNGKKVGNDNGDIQINEISSSDNDDSNLSGLLSTSLGLEENDSDEDDKVKQKKNDNNTKNIHKVQNNDKDQNNDKVKDNDKDKDVGNRKSTLRGRKGVFDEKDKEKDKGELVMPVDDRKQDIAKKTVMVVTERGCNMVTEGEDGNTPGTVKRKRGRPPGKVEEVPTTDKGGISTLPSSNNTINIPRVLRERKNADTNNTTNNHNNTSSTSTTTANNNNNKAINNASNYGNSNKAAAAATSSNSTNITNGEKSGNNTVLLKMKTGLRRKITVTVQSILFPKATATAVAKQSGNEGSGAKVGINPARSNNRRTNGSWNQQDDNGRRLELTPTKNEGNKLVKGNHTCITKSSPKTITTTTTCSNPVDKENTAMKPSPPKTTILISTPSRTTRSSIPPPRSATLRPKTPSGKPRGGGGSSLVGKIKLHKKSLKAKLRPRQKTTRFSKIKEKLRDDVAIKHSGVVVVGGGGRSKRIRARQ